jgi:hypothetical protein
MIDNRRDKVFLKEFLSVRDLILRPFVFFKNVEADKNWSKPIWWVIFSLVFYSVMLSFSTPIFASFASYLSEKFPILAVPLSLFFIPKSALYESLIYFSTIVIGIIFLPITQYIMEKVGGKKPLIQTVKAIYYPQVVSHLLGWIPILNFFVFFWTIFLFIKSLMFFQKLSLEKSVLFLIVTAIVDLLLIILFLLILGFFLLLILIGIGISTT